MESKSFVYKYIVRFGDIDQFKHTSFANYIKLMFTVCDVLFAHYLKNDFFDRYRMRLIGSSMQFRKQTILGDKILINIESVQNCMTQISLKFNFILESTNEQVSSGRQIYELVDLYHPEQKNTDMPEKLLKLVQDFSRREPLKVHESIDTSSRRGNHYPLDTDTSVIQINQK